MLHGGGQRATRKTSYRRIWGPARKLAREGLVGRNAPVFQNQKEAGVREQVV